MIQAKAMRRKERLQLISAMKREAEFWPEELVEMPVAAWPTAAKEMAVLARPVKVFRSRSLLVQVHKEVGTTRLSISGCVPQTNGDWPDLTWEQLERAKEECGFKGCWMVELYPPSGEVVNVANMRHLWLIPEPEFGWKR